MARATVFMKDLYGVLGDTAIVHGGNKVFLRKRPGKSTKLSTELAEAKKAKFGFRERDVRNYQARNDEL